MVYNNSQRVFFLFQHYPSWFVLDYWFFDIQILVLFKFNGNLMLISNHHFIFVSTESRSCSKSLPQQNKFLSSANKTNFRNLNTLQILLMYNITNYGLSTEPCGAPHDLYIITVYLHILMSIIKIVTKPWIRYLILTNLISYLSSFVINNLWSIVSFFFLNLWTRYILYFLLLWIFPSLPSITSKTILMVTQ